MGKRRPAVAIAIGDDRIRAAVVAELEIMNISLLLWPLNLGSLILHSQMSSSLQMAVLELAGSFAERRDMVKVLTGRLPPVPVVAIESKHADFYQTLQLTRVDEHLQVLRCRNTPVLTARAVARSVSELLKLK